MQDVLAVGKVALAAAVEREVEEGVLEVEAVVVIAVVAASVRVAVVRLAVAVEIAALVLVGQDLIGFGDLDEHVLSPWIFVFVRVPFFSEAFVDLLDLSLTRAFSYAQDFVRVHLGLGGGGGVGRSRLQR